MLSNKFSSCPLYLSPITQIRQFSLVSFNSDDILWSLQVIDPKKLLDSANSFQTCSKCDIQERSSFELRIFNHAELQLSKKER